MNERYYRGALICCIGLVGGWIAYRFMTGPYMRGDAFGWDLDVTCSGLEALNQHLNPYLLSNGTHNLPFPYPLVVAYMMAPICSAHSYAGASFLYIYTFVVAASGLITGIVLFRDPLLRILTTLVFLSGFDGLHKLLVTGNPAILELPFAVAVVVAYARSYTRIAGVMLGTMAVFKVIPIVFSIAFLIPPRRGEIRFEAFICALGAFAAGQIMNAMLDPSLLSSFGNALLGRIPDQHSPYNEAMGRMEDPNFIEFFIILMQKFGIDKISLITGVVALLFFSLGVGAARLANLSTEAPNNGLSILGLATLLLALSLFRLKPYAYITLIPFAVCTLVNGDRWQKLFGLFVIASAHVIWKYVGVWLPSGLISDYNQMLGLLSFLVVATAIQVWNWAKGAHPRLSPALEQ